MKALDFKHELSVIIQYVKNTWSLPDNHAFESAACDAFNQGLHDARFFIDSQILFRAGAMLSSTNKAVLPLSQRKQTEFNGISWASNYDGLCMVDDYVQNIIRIISENETRTGKFDYSKQALELSSRLKATHALSGITPKLISKPAQKQLINSLNMLSGLKQAHYPISEKLSYSNSSEYMSANQHNMDCIDWLISAIYSHGLLCAEEQNNQSILCVLIPVYKKFMHTELRFDNANDILDEISHHEFIRLGLQIQAPQFYTQGDFELSVKNELAFQARIARETPEDTAARLLKEDQDDIAFTTELLDEINSAEYKAKQEQRTIEIDSIIEQFRNTAPAYHVFI